MSDNERHFRGAAPDDEPEAATPRKLRSHARGFRHPIAFLRRHAASLPLWLIVLLVAVAARMVYLHQYSALPWSRAPVGADVKEYYEWAEDILGGETLWNRIRIHAPLYPYFLAGAHFLFRGNLIAVRTLQLALNIAAMLMLAGALSVRGRRAAWIAALLWGTFPSMLFYAGELVSEGLVVFWLCAGLWGLEAACRRMRICSCETPGGAIRASLRFLGVGLLFGLAAVTHPLTLVFGAVMGVHTGVRLARRRFIRAAAPLLFFAGFGLPVGAVVLRNVAVTGRPVLIQKHAGLNFYIGNGPGATGLCSVRPGSAYRRLTLLPQKHGYSDSNADQWFFRETFRHIRRHPRAWLRLLLRKLVLTWNARDIPTGADTPALRRQIPIMRLPLPGFWLVGPVALLGLALRSVRRRMPSAVLLVVVHSLVLTLFVTGGRYRMAMLPGAIALAALALDAGWRRVRRGRARFASHKRRIAAVTAGAVAAAAIVWLPRPPALVGRGEQAVVHAAALYRTGRLRQAAAVLRDWLHHVPHDGRAWHLYALVLDDLGRRTDALTACRRAAQLEPDDPEIQTNLAVAVSENGEKAEAFRLLLEILRTYPAAAEAWYNLGVLLQEFGRTGRAAAAYRQAIWGRPGLASAHLNLGIILQGRGRMEEALHHLRAAVRIAPAKVNAINALAVCYASQGRRRQAVRWFERSLHLNPRQPRVWTLYSDFLAWCGDREGSRRVIERARKALGSLPAAP